MTNPNGPDLILVGCGKAKQPHRSAARDLYASSYFAAKRRYAEASGCPWMIVSARYGLIYPGEVIEPYDLALNQLTDWDLYWWRWRVRRAFDGLGFEGNQRVVVELHMGVAYRDQIKKALEKKHNIEFIDPTEGMGIGHQLKWYKERRVA